MQFPGTAKPPVGIVFDTAMRRIDDALALAMLHGFGGKGQARIAAVSISNADLRAAQFCDGLDHFYASATTGPAAMFMSFSPIGLADGKPPRESPIFDKLGTPAYPTSIKNLNDTADGATLIRNVLMGQNDGNAAVVLSGPATDLVRLMELNGEKEWIARKVRLLCATEAGLKADGGAGAKLLADWPTPMVMVGPEIGDALPFPGASIGTDFVYAPDHPVAAVYRAYERMPYDAPSTAMAAMLYAVHPKDGYFKVSDQGKRARLVLDPEQKERIVKVFVEMASAKPVPRKPRKPAEEKKDEKKEEKKKDAADQ